ncbi:MAG: hypothetical protein E6R13_05990 [Spirochaetes bacterium]|nr:MAG: hypothetical protein E6R13_05990 [Spirochaetota bacterium]
MKKNKTKQKLTCAHCFHEFPASKHRAFKETHWCGDGDGPDDQEDYHSYDFEPTIVDSCPKCGEDVHVTMFIPEYVQAEPFPYFDIDTFLYARDALSEYKKKWYKVLDDGDYGLECDKSDLFLKIIKAKSLKEAKFKVKRKYHEFVEFVYNLKVKNISEEDNEDKEEVKAKKAPVPELVNSSQKNKNAYILSDRFSFGFIFTSLPILSGIGFYGWVKNNSKTDLVFGIIFSALLVGIILNELRIKYVKKEN